jgi:hypothetical protein
MLWAIRLSVAGTDTSEARAGEFRSELNSLVYPPRIVNVPLLYALLSYALIQRIWVIYKKRTRFGSRAFLSHQFRVRLAAGHFHFALSTAVCFRLRKHQDVPLIMAFTDRWLNRASLSLSCFAYRHRPMEHSSCSVTTETVFTLQPGQFSRYGDYVRGWAIVEFWLDYGRGIDQGCRTYGTRHSLLSQFFLLLLFRDQRLCNMITWVDFVLPPL